MTIVSESELIKGAIAGEIICFPTDTVPALAVIPESANKIFTLKQRSQEKPLILMGATPSDLWPFVTGTPASHEIWANTAQKYWPGALTLVLPASQQVNPQLNPQNTGTIGLRIPAQPIAISILSKTGPLATTSVNISGQPPLETLAEIEEQFPEILILKSENLTAKLGSGQPSTVVKWHENSWVVLRKGAITI